MEFNKEEVFGELFIKGTCTSDLLVAMLYIVACKMQEVYNKFMHNAQKNELPKAADFVQNNKEDKWQL